LASLGEREVPLITAQERQRGREREEDRHMNAGISLVSVEL